MSSSWRVDAACGGMETRQFFGPERAPSRAEDAEMLELAARTCGRCPVRIECGIEADRERDVGLRGGSLRRHVTGNRAHYRARRLIPGAYISPGDTVVEDHPALLATAS